MSSSSSHSRERVWIAALSVALAIYGLLVGIVWLSGVLSARSFSWLAAFVPLVLACWYAFGFLQPNDAPKSSPDYGLLLCAAGWALTALALLVPQSLLTTNSAGSAGNVDNIVSSSAVASSAGASSAGDMATMFCGVLALLCLLCGTVLSWRATANDNLDVANARSDTNAP